jgi:hypothetical protein
MEPVVDVSQFRGIGLYVDYRGLEISVAHQNLKRHGIVICGGIAGTREYPAKGMWGNRSFQAGAPCRIRDDTMRLFAGDHAWGFLAGGENIILQWRFD